MHDDVCSILARMRSRDAQEMREYGLDLDVAAAGFAAPAILARVFFHRESPAAVVTFHQLTPKALLVSMVATDDWPRVARAFLRWGVREARPFLIARGFTRAECRTMAGHDDAIRLLERLGFVLECRLPGFGAHGASFLQYAWRLNDHVLHEIPEGAAAAASATDA